MKRCPKCNRTFPDDNQKFCTVDGGLLVSADQPFDPNATIQGSANLLLPVEPPPEKPVSSRPPDFSETIATPSSAPTVVLPKKTGPTGQPTASNLQPPPLTTPPTSSAQPSAPSQPPSAPLPSQAATLPPSQTAPLPPSQPLQPTPSAPLPPTQTAALPPTHTAPLPTPKQAPSAPLPQSPVAAPRPVAAAPPPKKSKLPLVLGILAVLLVLGIGGVVAAFFLVVKPRLAQMNNNRGVVVVENPNGNTNSNTNTNENTNTSQPTPEPEKTQPELVPPPDTTKFANIAAGLDPKLAEHYFDFSFYYPNGWTPDPKAGKTGASNFVRVERRLPPDFMQENFAVGWYTSKGTFADDEAIYPERVEALSKTLATRFPEYRKVSEGPTKVNSLDGYEFRFVSLSKGTEKGDIQIWGRVIFLPTGVAGEQAGATLIMLATSLAPELSSVDDVGAKGQMPVILDSFRFAKAP